MAQQEAQKSTNKTAPKPGPAPKGIPQATPVGKAPKVEVDAKATEEKKSPAETKKAESGAPKTEDQTDKQPLAELRPEDQAAPAEATIQDYRLSTEEDIKPVQAAKKETAEASQKPKTSSKTETKPVETKPAKEEAKSTDEAKLTKELEARLTREIEARLRRELEPRIAREIELKLLRQFDSQLQKVVNDSVERAIKRHSQPNLPVVSEEEIEAFKKQEAKTTGRLMTPGALPIPEQLNQQRGATPAKLAVAQSPAAKLATPANLPKTNTPASLAVPKNATPSSMPVITEPPKNTPAPSPAVEQGAVVVGQGLQSAPLQTPPPSTYPIAQNSWEQDPSKQKAVHTQQIRVAKTRVSLDDVSPEKLIGPSPEDLGKDFLKDAGVSRGGKIAAVVLLLLALIGGTAGGTYYVYTRQVPNPPRTKSEHAAFAGVSRGLLQFPGEGPGLSVVYQPPTMLLPPGKGKKPAVAPVSTPKPTPVATPPKQDPPKQDPPKPPKLQVVPRQ